MAALAKSSRHAGAESAPAAAALAKPVRSLRRSIRLVLLTERAAIVVAALLAAAATLAFADFFFRTPIWMRLAVWALLAGSLVVGCLKLILPALRFHPALTDLALRIERSDRAAGAGLRGVLASALDLSAADEARAGPVIAGAVSGLEQARISSLIKPAGAIKSLSMLLMIVLAITAAWLAWPGLAGVGARRILTPWNDAQWPKRTAVADATGNAVHPLGAALPLRAALLRAPGRPESARVWAIYRVHNGEEWGPEQRVLLTSQDREVVLEAKVQGSGGAPAEPVTGLLFERLVDTDALLPAVPAAESSFRARLEYYFQTEDDHTPTSEIALVERPAVISARASIEAPAYLETTGPRSRVLDLGPGNDERAAPPGVLEGSLVELSIELNKPVPGPPMQNGAEWLVTALGDGIAPLISSGSVDAVLDGDTWKLSWVHEQDILITPAPVDEHGLAAAGDSLYRLPVLRDALPVVSVTSPESDKVVLPTAVIDLAAEARDDTGIASMSLEHRRAARPASSAGAPVEPLADWAAFPVEPGTEAQPDPRHRIVTTTLDLATLDLEPGQELWLSALAVDTFALGDRRHDPIRSTIRRLTIVSPEDLLAQVWNDLAAVRRSALRLDEDQTKASADLRADHHGEKLEQAAREQAGITERLTRERQEIARIAERLRENRLADAELEQVMQDASELLDRASASSAAASDQLRQAESLSGESPAPEQAAAAEAQDQVAAAMSELASLLDRGQDTWAMKRSLQRLLDEQRRLQEQTNKLSQTTAGKSAEELSQQERADVEQTARQQAAAAQKAAEALANMDKQQEALKQSDPAAAQAAAEAVKRGTQDRLADRMQEAAQQIQQNQTASASAQQGKAIESLEEMLEQLENAGAKRDEALRRYLASVIDSLQVLITEQQTQLATLAAAAETGAYAGLDDGMVRLNQNTLAVLGDAEAEAAQGGDAEAARPVLNLISGAADAQSSAVAALRAAAVATDEARTQEELSLQRLERALEEAQKLDEQAEERENERRAAELKKAYREALAQQVAISEQTASLAEQQPTRRTRAQARALGEQQGALRTTLEQLKGQNTELVDAVVFDFAHQRLDESMAAAATALGEGTADAAVVRRQLTSERLLRSLLEALEKPKPSDEFRENESGGGGGGGGQGGKPQLVPPIAQLKLLRAMQAEAMDLTRLAAENEADAALADEAAKFQQNLTDRAAKLLESLAPQEEQAPPAPGTPQEQPQ